MKKFYQIMCLSFAYMTRLNVKINFDVTDDDVSKTSMFFPITSLFVGFVMCLVYFIFEKINLPLFAIIAGVFSNTLITGALHVDGFIDCADAFFVSKSKQRALDILKDSHVGAYGTVACVFLYLAKIALIYEIYNQGINVLPVLLTMPVSAKIAMVTCAYFSRYPRQNGSGKSIVTLIKLHQVIIVYLLCTAILGIFFEIWCILILIIMIGLGFLYINISKAKLGGCTGDVLGSVNESGEIFFLAIVFAINQIIIF